MVKELRHIILSQDEFIPALEAHNRVTPNYLPSGKILRYECIDQDFIRVIIQITPSGQEVALIVDSSKMLQALIRFCLENNIMLPRQGQKSVLIEDDRVSLCIALDLDDLIETLVVEHLPICAEIARA